MKRKSREKRINEVHRIIDEIRADPEAMKKIHALTKDCDSPQRHMENKTQKSKPKCECPDASYVSKVRQGLYLAKERKGMNHKPHKCKGTFDLKQYKRDDKILWLCSCCTRIGDREV